MKKFLRTILLGVGLIALTACSGGPADLPTISKEDGEAKYAAIKQKEQEARQSSSSFALADSFTLNVSMSGSGQQGNYAESMMLAFDATNYYFHYSQEDTSASRTSKQEAWAYYKDGKFRQVVAENGGAPVVQQEAEVPVEAIAQVFSGARDQAKQMWMSASGYNTIDTYLSQFSGQEGVNITYGSDGSEGSLQIKATGSMTQGSDSLSVEANVIFSNYFLTYVSATISGTMEGVQGSTTMSLATSTSCELSYPNV